MEYFQRIKTVYYLATIGRAIRRHLQPMIGEKLSRPTLRALAKLKRTPPPPQPPPPRR